MNGENPVRITWMGKRRTKVCDNQESVYGKEEIANPPTSGPRRRRRRYIVLRRK